MNIKVLDKENNVLLEGITDVEPTEEQEKIADEISSRKVLSYTFKFKEDSDATLENAIDIADDPEEDHKIESLTFVIE